jgi:hypothetical protein
MKYFTLFFLVIVVAIFAQNPPQDFKLIGTTEGVAPWTESETITILANGQIHFFSSKGGSVLQILLDTNFTISSSQVQKIWQAIQSENFFSLNDNFEDDTLRDGSIALFTITANGNTKQVRVKNTSQQQIQNIISTINSNVPFNYNLYYTPPEKINIIPQDPCNSIFGSSFSIDKKNFSKGNQDKLRVKFGTINSVVVPVQIPHAGIEIGYQESLYDAVGNGTASLSSKGDYYGDDVSITGDNSQNIIPPDNTIHIKLNLEFYGPCDNNQNEFKIVKDIYKKWNGLTTSSGEKIEMEVVSLSHPGATTPPGTPGFDNIKLACGNGTSFCDKVGTANDGVVGGTWYPSDNTSGTFGHEVGHLMGLDDQYSSFIKQPDGSWSNEQDGTIKYSASDFLNLYHSKHPGDKLSDDQNFLNNNQRSGWPKDGHENDLMGDQEKPPLQSDIDNLAEQAGLIINIKPGDMLVNTENYEQNLVINRSGDLFLKPGAKQTLNGIYAACVDHYRLAPDSARVFAVAPPLEKWNGINAAQALLKVVRYIDSLGYYCNLYDDSFAQEAIWRITDNVKPYDTAADSLLINAGININQSFDFPKMIYDKTDIISSQYIPDQLFAVDIQPKSIDTKINEKTNFTASISTPSVGYFDVSFSWLLDLPNFYLDQLVANGSNAILTPLQRGVYPLKLDVTVKDSTGAQREILPNTTAYAIVADKYTETFEHKNLNDLFPWKTYGDVPWTITNKTAQTGSSSIQSGSIDIDQISTLEISIDMPSDSVVKFAVKTNISWGFLNFYIDTYFQSSYEEYNDWTFQSFNLKAGKHVLNWVYKNFSINTDNSQGAWLDNIFFPTNSVLLTSVKSSENIPLIFKLFQNYPNPFNPTTTINYSIPTAGIVSLKVYDMLGKEIATLVNEEKPAGSYEAIFSANASVSSGIYFYRLQAGNFFEIKKMILLK